MDLSRICIETRLRNGWEALDLGVAMTRAWWWPLQLSCLLPSVTVYLIVCLLFPEPAWLALLVAWWLNPLWDRFPLVLASRGLFSEPLNVRAVWREWRRIFAPDWFAWLTWRRFSPTRSFDMPVTVLENVGGDLRTRRLHVLHRTSSSAAFTLTFVCLCIIAIIVVSAWALASLLVPQGVSIEELNRVVSESSWWARASTTAWFVAMTLVAPFYSVGGFALYISRRIELEGWDIEIRFRHLAERVSRSSSPIKRQVAALLFPMLILAAGGGIVSPAEAQDDPPLPPVAEAVQAKQTIVEVLQSEDFNRKRVETGWRLKQSDSEGFPGWLIWLLDVMESIFDFFKPLFEFIGNLFATVPYLLWIALIAIVGYAVYRFRDALASVLGAGPRIRADAPQQPDTLFGLDLRQETLPDDVPTQVMLLWRDGKHREAIGLLYRATLSGLIHQFSFEFYDGYTEQECAMVVKARGSAPLTRYVERLTIVWQQLAYAHRQPPEQLVAELCGAWPEHFANNNKSSTRRANAA